MKPLELAIKLESAANARPGHWGQRHAKVAGLVHVAEMACRAHWGAPLALPLLVTLTRIAPRRLDSDNIVGAFKSIRDGIAKWLRVDDRTSNVRWRIRQARRGAGVYAVTIELGSLAGHQPLSDIPLVAVYEEAS